MNMLQMCTFVPFLHSDTPRPSKIPKSHLFDPKFFLPNLPLAKEFLNTRELIMKAQD